MKYTLSGRHFHKSTKCPHTSPRSSLFTVPKYVDDDDEEDELLLPTKEFRRLLDVDDGLDDGVDDDDDDELVDDE